MLVFGEFVFVYVLVGWFVSVARFGILLCFVTIVVRVGCLFGTGVLFVGV